MAIHLAPRRWLTVSLLLMAGLTMVDISLALQEPTLGIAWRASEQGLKVADIEPDGPANRAGMVSGMTVLSIHTARNHLPLSSINMIKEPDALENYAANNRFFASQNQLFTIIHSEKIQLNVAEHGMVTLHPSTRRLGQLPFIFWFQIICGFIAWATSMMVIIFRPEHVAARLYAMMGVAFVLVTFSTAIYSGRELAISGDLFRLLYAMNHFSGGLMAASFVALLWQIPQQINKFPIFRVLFTVYTSLWLADVLQWRSESSAYWFHLPIMLGLLCGLIIALIQWYKSSRQPDHRLTLKWMMFSMLLPGSLYVGGITFLHWLHIPGIIPQGYAYGFLALMYVFISLGITRFALFDLGDWWQKIWLWLLIGLLFIGMDIIFVSLLKWDTMLSTLTALSVVGFLYLPIRQWMINYIFKRRTTSLEQIVPDILKLALHAKDRDALRQAWKSLLDRIFSPLSINYVEYENGKENPETSEMMRLNIALMIPDIGAGSPLLLAYADQGSRLFSSKDRAFVATLVALTRKTIEDASAYQKGIGDERLRITSDIHDDLGAKLLSLVYKSENKEQRTLARQAINDLRDIIDYHQEGTEYQYNWLAQWRRECMQRAEESGAQLQWHQWHISDHCLPAYQAQQLSRILREALSNALKHGDGRGICIRIQICCGRLLMSVRNHGSSFPADAGQGRGIHHMKARIQDMHGTIRWRAGKKGGCHVIWAIPLDGSIDA